MAKIKMRVNGDEEAEHWGCPYSAGECGTCHDHSGKLVVPTSAILFLDIHPREPEHRSTKALHKNVHSSFVITAGKCISPIPINRKADSQNQV